jgi:hypothetical protein
MDHKVGRPSKDEQAIRLLKTLRQQGIAPQKALAIVALKTALIDVTLADLAWELFPAIGNVGTVQRCRFRQKYKGL